MPVFFLTSDYRFSYINHFRFRNLQDPEALGAVVHFVLQSSSLVMVLLPRLLLAGSSLEGVFILRVLLQRRSLDKNFAELVLSSPSWLKSWLLLRSRALMGLLLLLRVFLAASFGY